METLIILYAVTCKDIFELDRVCETYCAKRQIIDIQC